MILRAANTNDLPAITAIYNDAVLNSTATFDIENKTLFDMQIWFNHHDEKYCVVVCEINNEIKTIVYIPKTINININIINMIIVNILNLSIFKPNKNTVDVMTSIYFFIIFN